MKFYRKEQLKDSRIFFDKNPPLFGTIFIVSMGVLLVGAIVITNFLTKPYIVKAQGVVNTSDNQYVSVNVNGTVVEMLAEEGDIVEAGQALLKVTNGQEDLQVQSLTTQLEQAREKLEAMDLYQKSLNDKENYMINTGIQQEYYGYMEYFLSQVNSDNYSISNLQNSLNENLNERSNLTKEINALESEINLIVIPSVTEKEILNLETTIDSNKMTLSNLKTELLEITDETKKKEQNKKIDLLSAEIKNQEKSLFELNEKLESKQERENKKLEIQAQIDDKMSIMESMNEEIRNQQEQLNNPSSQNNQMEAQLLMELGKSRTAVQTQITELESNLLMYSNQADTYVITARNYGIVHYLSPIQIGMSVQQNQTIAEISKQEEESFVIEAYVNATDIAKISVGDKVNVAIAGVNVSKYGTIEGTLISIDSGTISQETSSGNALLYRALININDYHLTSKKDTIQVIKSMPVEVRIVYEEETYLEWILELLNFRQ